MLTIGDKFPSFKLKATVSLEKGKEFEDDRQPITRASGRSSSSGRRISPSSARPRSPRSGSATETSRTATRRCWASASTTNTSTSPGATHHPDLKDLPFPMLADIKRELSGALGILHKQDGVAMRATYIVDPEGIIRFVNVTDLDVGRNVDEVVRVLDALQTDELCPCNWQKGEPTLEAA